MAEEQGEQRTLTYGEKAVGLSFNPGNNPEVHAVKVAYAAIIDQLAVMRRDAGDAEDSEKVRVLSIAITEAQTAQMWAVKAITWGL